jgi:hypothetical protein
MVRLLFHDDLLASLEKGLGAPGLITLGLILLDFPRERFGYHVVYDREFCDAIDFASSHGFGYIVPDLMIPRFWPERFNQQERRRIRRHASDRGVSISFHGPSDTSTW